MKYEWKPCSMSVRISPKVFNSKLMRTFELGMKDARECLQHSMNHSIWDRSRRYRRGKNRCVRCGYKLSNTVL